MDLLSNKLEKLANTSSGYIESLPEKVQERIARLEDLEEKHAKIDAKLRKEIAELERKYAPEMERLYLKRKLIIGAGACEKTDEGIPFFWLTVLKNTPEMAYCVTERDEEALKYLCDISLSNKGEYGFVLSFEFEENPYFTNRLLTKEYFVFNSEEPAQNDLCFDSAVGCELDWKPGMNLRKKQIKKKKRHKKTGESKIVDEIVPAESFFDFFYPVELDCQDEDIDDLRFQAGQDFELGYLMKKYVIPHAVRYFTGEAVEDEYESEDESEEGDEAAADEEQSGSEYDE